METAESICHMPRIKRQNNGAAQLLGRLKLVAIIKNIFKTLVFYKKTSRRKNNYTYCISGRNRVKTALSELYSIKDEIDFFYQRKYEKFVELSKSPRAK